MKVYGARGPLSDPPLLGEYLVVLAADAEAHEKAAVEQARQDAIRDCIQAVKVLGLCNCTALAITADDLHDEWCIERITVERLALLTEGSE